MAMYQWRKKDPKITKHCVLGKTLVGRLNYDLAIHSCKCNCKDTAFHDYSIVKCRMINAKRSPQERTDWALAEIERARSTVDGIAIDLKVCCVYIAIHPIYISMVRLSLIKIHMIIIWSLKISGYLIYHWRKTKSSQQVWRSGVLSQYSANLCHQVRICDDRGRILHRHRSWMLCCATSKVCCECGHNRCSVR
jgi:hypothetical protein